MDPDRDDYAEGEPPVSSELVKTLALIVGLTLLVGSLACASWSLWPDPFD